MSVPAKTYCAMAPIREGLDHNEEREATMVLLVMSLNCSVGVCLPLGVSLELITTSCFNRSSTTIRSLLNG